MSLLNHILSWFGFREGGIVLLSEGTWVSGDEMNYTEDKISYHVESKDDVLNIFIEFGPVPVSIMGLWCEEGNLSNGFIIGNEKI